VSLKKRKELAAAWDGDLFISIHGNAAPNRHATGTQVFTVSDRGASDQTASELADRENATDLVGGVPPETDDDVLAILVDLKMGDRIQKSTHFASLLSSELTGCDLGPVKSKRAGFVVLKSLAMPSVLVEVGFLSSSGDVAKLKRADHRQRYAEALARAVEAYFAAYAPVAVAPDGTHEVAPGETLWSIARRYGRSVAELRDMNDLPDDCTIYVGQKLSVAGS
jgi:N-acetylmuramoyl-L-alanine amidase